MFERDDFGSGTSAATTKAIHGGLRYLEQYDFGVVAESVSERRYLGLAAPHLVQPRSFLLTAYDWSAPRHRSSAPVSPSTRRWPCAATSACPRTSARPASAGWARSAPLKQVPWLTPEGLTGAWRHDDTLNIHPERLLLAILQSFVADAGTAVNHAPVTGLLRDAAGTVRGVQVTGDTDIEATVVINAAGLWVAAALGDLAEPAGVRVKQAKGVHLVTRDLGGARRRVRARAQRTPHRGQPLGGQDPRRADGHRDGGQRRRRRRRRRRHQPAARDHRLRSPRRR
ncbi:FAD-dependent oxidoreductase [Corynebacterium suedekumii]|nr:FAD-dependent oxidoreductase [Corynebacterium suedekumii]